MEEKITVNEDQATKLDQAKIFGEGFLDCVCDECKDKCTRWMKKHLYLLPFPAIFGKKMQVLLCKKCRINIRNRLKGK
jgi:hypothetical protein